MNWTCWATAAVSAPRKRGEVARDGHVFEVYTRGFMFAGEQEPERQVLIEFSGDRVGSMSSGGRAVDLMRLDPVQIGGIFPQHGEDRVLVQLTDVPEHFRQALLAVEDRNFYHHWGFSFLGIARAAFNNLRSGQVVAGGSTITQQLVKNFYLTSERTIVRKLTEVAMAVLLELHYEKDLILETYINEVYLGQGKGRARCTVLRWPRNITLANRSISCRCINKRC
ncbi:MAG: transglycosylase domain-containing protein [Haliea sp.]|nr:transglycosylase domain-containing protein [Haliea sp.]